MPNIESTTNKFSLEQVLEMYDFVLLDSSLFGSSKNIPERVYEIHNPKKMFYIEEDINDYLNRLKAKTKQLAGRKNVFITSGVKDELARLRDHFIQCYNFMDFGIEKEVNGARYNKRFFNPRDGRKRLARYRNMKIGKTRRMILATSADEIVNSYKEPIEILQEIGKTIDKFLKNVKTYDCASRNYDMPNDDKISETDAGLVYSMFSYLKSQENRRKKGTIITGDGDIPFMFFYFLNKCSKNLRRDLMYRARIHFYIREEETTEMLQYHFVYNREVNHPACSTR